MQKEYRILIDGNVIGSTFLEYGDAPMGVAYGEIHNTWPNFGYEFLINYCKSNKIPLAEHLPDDKLVFTRTIEKLVVINDKGIEISGVGNQIRCIDGEILEISIEGIPYPLCQEEFLHHVEEYANRHGK